MSKQPSKKGSKQSNSGTLRRAPPKFYKKLSGENWEYDVVRLLGEGSFGSVYEASRYKKDQDSKVALKFIEMPTDAREKRQLEKEIKILERVSRTNQSNQSDSNVSGECHKGIVCHYGHFNWKDTAGKEYVVMIMEHIEGMDLYDLITEIIDGNFVLDDQAHRQIICTLADTLYYVHEKIGIAHRDIKPENMMFVMDGPDAGTIKMIDFGLSCPLESCKHFSGTVEYLSPELMDIYGDLPEGYDYKKSDIWALGMTLYILINGESFIDLSQVTDNSQLYKAVYFALEDLKMGIKTIPPLRTHNREISRIVMGMLQMDHTKRITIKKILEEFCQGPPSRPPPTPPKRQGGIPRARALSSINKSSQIPRASAFSSLRYPSSSNSSASYTSRPARRSETLISKDRLSRGSSKERASSWVML